MLIGAAGGAYYEMSKTGWGSWCWGSVGVLGGFVLGSLLK
jgi:hypothetical protein